MHISVLQKEVVGYLDPRPGANLIDGTCGAGGHTLEILKSVAPAGKILCLDLDAGALARAKSRIEKEAPDLAKNVIFAHANFADIKQVVAENSFSPVNGIVVDLGMSSDQLDASGRGFSFQKDETLDMRFSLDQELTAAHIVNQWSRQDLEKILKEYGEEKFYRRIAEELIKIRKIKPIITTRQLTEVVTSAVPKKYQYGRTNVATKTFQALRIVVNDELGSLEKFLPQALQILAPQGRLTVISFHSLEDRIVKNFFKNRAKDGQVRILTKKPVVAGEEEINRNPRSRSAKLRAIAKI